MENQDYLIRICNRIWIRLENLYFWIRSRIIQTKQLQVWADPDPERCLKYTYILFKYLAFSVQQFDDMDMYGTLSADLILFFLILFYDFYAAQILSKDVCLS